VYGGRMPRDLSPSLKQIIKAMGRQALHHHRMRFVHPVTGEEMTFASPPSEDILRVAGAAGLDIEINC